MAGPPSPFSDNLRSLFFFKLIKCRPLQQINHFEYSTLNFFLTYDTTQFIVKIFHGVYASDNTHKFSPFITVIRTHY